MKNKLLDLNNHLFAALERLGDESLSDDELKSEVERSKAIQGVAGQIVDNAKLIFEAKKFQVEYNQKEMPLMLGENKSG